MIYWVFSVPNLPACLQILENSPNSKVHPDVVSRSVTVLLQQKKKKKKKKEKEKSLTFLLKLEFCQTKLLPLGFMV